MTLITELGPTQVLIFGANKDGFHGAGSAGLACRGDTRNNWRQDDWFLNAIRSPEGSIDRRGRWAVFGVARGWQQGIKGMSYAIQTIEKPGERRSTPLSVIEDQLVNLCGFATDHPGWEFLATPIGIGYAGYTPEEMTHCWENAFKRWVGKPANITIPEDGLYFLKNPTRLL